MSDTVKLIVTLSKGQYEALEDMKFGGIGSRMIFNAVKNGILLEDIDGDETRAYFDGQAYGWEQGRKALIEDLKSEIKSMEYHMIDCDVLVSQEEVLEILEKYKGTTNE